MTAKRTAEFGSGGSLAAAIEAAFFDGSPAVAYRTAVFSFLAAAAPHDFIMPSRPGFVFAPAQTAMCHMLTRNAALGTNLVWTIARGGVALSPTNSNLTPALTNVVAAPERVGTAMGTAQARVDGTLPLQALIVTPTTGAGLTDCTGFFEIIGAWSPLAP